MHRDSLALEQLITAGAVNLMVASSGIVHLERGGGGPGCAA
jgi:redox-sensitive bicupin YhaK (pirin superfamily)